METISQWHKRFKQQAKWTRPVLDYLISKFKSSNSSNFLEVGCGTGAILDNLDNVNNTFGLDINLERLKFRAKTKAANPLICGDAHQLPFTDNFFDASFCHFLFLWVSSPAISIAEMIRVTQPGGHVFAIAEPEYGGRIYSPKELIKIGNWQTKALIEQGADPYIGKELNNLFTAAGLEDVEGGEIKNAGKSIYSEETLSMELGVLENDLKQFLSSKEIINIQKVIAEAWNGKDFKLYVPTYYAIGTKPNK